MTLPNKFTSCLLILIFAVAAAAQSASIYTLPSGTKIRARMDNEIGSRSSSLNDTFTVTVSSPVVVKDNEMLPVGTVIEGRITEVKPAAAAGSDGRFKVSFETMRLPNGQKRRIDAELSNFTRRKTSGTRRNLLTILGGTAFGVVIGGIAGKSTGALVGAGVGAGAGSLVAGLRKGRELSIKSNEEIEINLLKDLVLPVEDF